ncbi:hypothetical protein SLS60_000116 [Paraconiothyrium brasiliense]|uniref:Uncharacterized protein n=1 Tax=Paraconiothyrium brasiliense TaxID=300254 RepID=A0ABR3S6I6_9PLEO
MTSYTSIVKAYVPDHDSGNQINFDSFLPVLYVIHDGNRIDQAKDYLVTDSPKFNTKSYDPILIRPLGQDICIGTGLLEEFIR